MLAGIWLLAGEHFESDDAERELVGAAVHGLALHLLWRHIMRRTDYGAGDRELLRRGDFGDSEIGDLGSAVGRDHDVGGFDVAMDDAFAVCVIEGDRGLAQDAEDALAGSRLGA